MESRSYFFRGSTNARGPCVGWALGRDWCVRSSDVRLDFWNNQWIFQVPVKGGRDYTTSQKAIYKWYILPIGGLYATYHLLGEPETTIDLMK